LFAGISAIDGLVGSVIVVFYDFAFAYNITGIVGVFVNNVEFVYRVVLVSDDVFVFYDALGAGAVKHLTHGRIAPALVTTVCACAVHG
jgi:hypothetical protein